MKKALVIIALLAIVTPVMACSKTEAASAEAVSETGILSESYENALPIVGQLVVGTLQLEGEAAVDAAQEAELRPLWMAYKSLCESDSASTLEVEAVTGQIEDAMTEEQLQAIAEMGLTREDMMALSEEQGIEMGGGMGQDMTEEQREAMQAQFAAGGGPGEGAPGGIPGVGATGGQTPSEDEIAKLRAQREPGGPSMTPLIEALIERLSASA